MSRKDFMKVINELSTWSDLEFPSDDTTNTAQVLSHANPEFVSIVFNGVKINLKGEDLIRAVKNTCNIKGVI